MFRRTLSIVAIALFGLAAFAAPGHAEVAAWHPTQVISNVGFDQTVSNLKKLVAKNSMMIMGEVDQGKIMSMTGVKMHAVSFLVGSPVVGKKLFSQDVGAAVAAPFRVTVYENAKGQTVISYFPPSQMLSSFDNEQIAMVGKMLDEKLAGLARMAGR
jgi:uncharacterized protein (DUF302 family)